MLLINRLVSVLFLLPVVIGALFFLSKIQFIIFVFAICLVAAWEWGNIMQFSTNMYVIWLVIISSLLLTMGILMQFQNILYFNFWLIFWCIFNIIVIWWLIAFVLILFYPVSAVFWKESNILRCCFGILMIFPFFWGVLILHQFYDSINNISGAWWLLYIMTLVWINDSAAYIIGYKFGKHKLLKQVSPQKTWEGFFGGAVVSIGLNLLFIRNLANDIKYPIIFVVSTGSIFLSVIGDLTESMFKRESKIKDSSGLIPGHGGVLDRIDGLIAAIPFFACFILLIYISSDY